MTPEMWRMLAEFLDHAYRMTWWAWGGVSAAFLTLACWVIADRIAGTRPLRRLRRATSPRRVVPRAVPREPATTMIYRVRS